jgi:hypothetical protein
MPPSSDEINRPIFIVSSGRSGSTILTWCLGQHPNITPQEESDWLGPFATDAALGYARGSARGERGQLSANFIGREELLAALGQSINRLILSHRKEFENLERRQQAGWWPPPFAISRSANDPKSRWVDGTPENCFYICGLRKLFPDALFVHLVRDVLAVVRSLLNFFPDGQKRLVDNEQAAYEYWLRRVTVSLEAEQAYGPRVVHRLRYSDLTERPEFAMRSLLGFLGEPFSAACLEPLNKRINSANVAPDFTPDEPATNPAIVKRARDLSDELQNSPQAREASTEAAEKLQADFDRQVSYCGELGKRYAEAQKLIAKLQKDCEMLEPSDS